MFPIVKSANHAGDPHALYAVLRRKQLEIKQVQEEIEALNGAILLLADDENEFYRSSPPRPESKMRPWPICAFRTGNQS